MDTLLDVLLTALSREGIPAYREFPQPGKGIYTGGFFVTAAFSSVACDAPVPCADGAALPAEVTLRLRYHCRTDADLILHMMQTDAVLESVLGAAGCTLLRAERGEIRYSKQLDRYVTETQVVLGGMLRTTRKGEDAP